MRLHLLLSINENFDDDLLKDALKLLVYSDRRGK